MSYTMKSVLALVVTGGACLILLYFIYSFFWFVSIGRRGQKHRANVITSLGFIAVLIAIGLWLFASVFFGSWSFAFERLVLFASIGLCLAAIIVARFGSPRTSVPIVTAAVVVALNSIGTIYMQ